LLRVATGGTQTTLQDLGRFGYQRFGLPVAGALDPFSLRLANALVGNDPAAAAIEILGHGPTLEVDAESVRVAFTGSHAGFEVRGEETTVVPSYRSHTVYRGERVAVRAMPDSQVGYLAVEGGFEVEPVLGSLSTYTRAGIGGFGGRALRGGDALPLTLPRASERTERRLADPPSIGHECAIRLVLGPQHEAFTREAVETLLTSTFTVSRDVDRMGMRLDGPTLEHSGSFNLVSDGIATGCIQVPGSGQPIVLLADHQTTGGYPKIGGVISADIPLLGRRRPGDVIRFEEISVPQAEAARRSAERDILQAIKSIADAPPLRGIDLDCLYNRNLISGVIDAWD
jgi:biotin-dependent carboxylase-like uncharacterized protein